MPSSQTPPAIGLATDPTAVRPAIDDAAIERIEPGALMERLAQLKAEGYTMLLDIGGVDYPQRVPRFDVVYHLLALPLRKADVREVGTPKRFRLMCGVPAANPALPTATGLWLSADWAEREIFDLFGITFEGHPDLRRIQMPHDWEGYPLRKDYPITGSRM